MKHVSVDVSRQYDPVALTTVEAYYSNPVTVPVEGVDRLGVLGTPSSDRGASSADSGPPGLYLNAVCVY